jgi:hypothetical protein
MFSFATAGYEHVAGDACKSRVIHVFHRLK